MRNYKEISGAGAQESCFNISPGDSSIWCMLQHVLVNANTFYKEKYLIITISSCLVLLRVFALLLKDAMFVTTPSQLNPTPSPLWCKMYICSTEGLASFISPLANGQLAPPRQPKSSHQTHQYGGRGNYEGTSPWAFSAPRFQGLPFHHASQGLP